MTEETSSSSEVEGLEEVAVGIDLGTTYSCVAVFQNGQAKVIPNEYGNRITPSVVSFTDKGLLIGDDARRKLKISPTTTVYESKRLIGRTYDDPDVQKDKAIWPFTLIDQEGKPKIEVCSQGEMKTYCPEEISAMVLLKMKDLAEKWLKKKVTKAVITVPAYFNESQRRATKAAGEIAGLDVLRIINEPTAAALAYGVNKKALKKVESNILVYDLGGGTFDVSILLIDDELIRVLASSGDTHLGGSDFDNQMAEEMLYWFNNQFKRHSGEPIDVGQLELNRLRFACEFAKCMLSEQKSASVHIDKFYKQQDLKYDIEREHFEEINIDSFNKTMRITNHTLAKAKLEPSDIDEVILIGGSTRIPKVKEMLQYLFEGKKLNSSLNPDEVVARGAAIQAAILSGNTSSNISDLTLMDVTPLTLGAQKKGGIMAEIIPRNSLIPCKGNKSVKTTKDNQKKIGVKIYQGERPMCKDNHFLGEFILKGITPAPQGVPDLEIRFSVDVDGCLEATARDKGTGKQQTMIIDYNQSMCSADEIQRLLDEAAKHRTEDMEEKERIQARNQLETLVHWLKYIVDNHEDDANITDDDKSTVLGLVQKTQSWLTTNCTNDKSDYMTKKQEVLCTCKGIPTEYLNPGTLPEHLKIQYLWNPAAVTYNDEDEYEFLDEDFDDDYEVPVMD